MKPHENVAKRVFKISQQQIRVDYHFVEGRITNNAHIYDKDGSYSLIQVCMLSRAFNGELSLPRKVNDCSPLKFCHKPFLICWDPHEPHVDFIFQH